MLQVPPSWQRAAPHPSFSHLWLVSISHVFLQCVVTVNNKQLSLHIRCVHHQGRPGGGNYCGISCLQHPGHHRSLWNIFWTGRLYLFKIYNFTDSLCFLWLFTIPASQTIILTWWPLFRDSTFYILSVLALILVRSTIFICLFFVVTLN